MAHVSDKQQPVQLQITVDTADGQMPCHLWLPGSVSGPGLVMLQEIFGVSSYIRGRAADLASLGYVVLAPEIYWRLPVSSLDESADDLLSEAMGLAAQVDWDLAVADAGAALRYLRSRPEVTGGAGVIGFCFGGGLAFNVAAVESPDVLVSYYGSALPRLLDLAESVQAPSLHHFGRADAFISAADRARIEEVLTRRPETRFETYEDANHAFDNPSPQFHNAEASKAAWRTTVEFLAETLPAAAAVSSHDRS